MKITNSPEFQLTGHTVQGTEPHPTGNVGGAFSAMHDATM